MCSPLDNPIVGQLNRGHALGTQSRGVTIIGDSSHPAALVHSDNNSVSVTSTPGNHSNNIVAVAAEQSSIEMAVRPDLFTGTSLTPPAEWLADVRACADLNQYNHSQTASMMRFSFDGDAKVWYITLPEATQKDWINGPRRPNLGQQQKQLTKIMQQTGQSAIEFINAVTSKARGLDLSDAVLLRIIESGLRPEYLPFFKQARATNPAELLQCEALQAVPAAVASVDSADLLVAMDRMLSEKLASLNLRAPQHPQHQDSPDVHAMQPTQQQRTSGYTSGYTPDHGPRHRYTPQTRQQYSDEQQDRPCGYCGTRCWGGKCPALGNLCTYCHKPDHFPSVCRTKRRDSQSQRYHQQPHPRFNQQPRFHKYDSQKPANYK